jgi:hypothetical protein
MAPPMVQFVFSSPGTLALQELESDGMAIAMSTSGMYMHRFKQGNGVVIGHHRCTANSQDILEI